MLPRVLCLIVALLAVLGGATVAPATVAPEDVPALDAWVHVPKFGVFRIRFDPSATPNHVSHFLGLAAQGFYDGLCVHRVVPGLLVQYGNAGMRDIGPRRGELLPPDYRLPEEGPAREIPRGTVAMAWQDQEPGTAGTEWFVAVADRPELTGQATVIGEVIEGMVVIDGLAQVPCLYNRRPLDRYEFTVHLGDSSLPEGEMPASVPRPAPED